MIHPYTPETRMQLRKPVNRSRERVDSKLLREFKAGIRRSFKGSKTPFINGLTVVYRG